MHSFNNIHELKSFYNKFSGKSLSSIEGYIKVNYPEISISTNKGVVGQILEALIGNSPNSNPNPDVENLDIELKVLPLRKVSNKIQPKERSKIKSINYNKIVDEEWKKSSVRNKLKKILFLMYEHPIGKSYKDWKELVFKGTLLYVLSEENENTVRDDWSKIQSKVISGLANSLSESDSKILGACTSGTGKLVKYGNNFLAKQRSYSLKHSYLKVFFNRKKKNLKYSSLRIDNKINPENYILDIINSKLEGRFLQDVVLEYDLDFSQKSKSSFRLLINKIFKIDENRRILELDENDMEIKTIPVNNNLIPWEAMSFPKFSLVDILNENWDGENEPEFKSMISQNFIFIPIIKEKEKYFSGDKAKYRYKNWKTWKIGKSKFWKADSYNLSMIKKEWEKMKSIVKGGVKVTNVKYGKKTRQENNLLKSSCTKIIHVRPHAKDSNDIDIPYFNYSNTKISWQSFWFNKSFIKEIIS